MRPMSEVWFYFSDEPLKIREFQIGVPGIQVECGDVGLRFTLDQALEIGAQADAVRQALEHDANV